MALPDTPFVGLGARGARAPDSSRTGARRISAVSAAVVDIVVTVHDALQDVQRCLESLIEHGGDPPARVIVVNDGSGDATSRWLRDFSSRHRGVELIEHPLALGYTKAVNAGLRASRAPYVVLLNSDTITTPRWLGGLIRCAESDPKIGMVGPLSNAATWQNVPALTDASGSFAVNALPPGTTPREMGRLVAELSARRYPRTPFVNGFCFLIKRALIDAIGEMDEAAFPIGYGEENDYAIRAAEAGFALAIADDVYVYHAKSRSFGHARRQELSRAGTAALHAKHGELRVKELVAEARALPLHDLRAALSRALCQRQQSVVDPLSLRVLFLLPAKGGAGGAHSVVQEAVAMRRVGVEARIAVRPRDGESVHRLYADVPGVDDLFVWVHPGNLLSVTRDYDVCVATVHSSVDLLAQVIKAHPHILPAYYVQDYEPYFFDEGSREAVHARASYSRVPNVTAFAKTDWIAREVEKQHGLYVHRVLASVDHDVYFPAPRAWSATLSVAAMIRPKTQRRAPERTLRVLGELAARHPGKVEIHLFGAEKIDADFATKCWGVLTRREVAALLRRCDVFVDLSDYQAFGRTALEAMASGCAVVVPQAGGCDEFARDGENAIVVDTADEAQCLERLDALVSDRETCLELRREGLATAARYSTHLSAVSELALFARQVSAHRAAAPRVPVTRARALYLVPERDSRGRVTLAGYARLALPWQASAVWGAFRPTVVGRDDLPRPEPESLTIVQATAVAKDRARLVAWIRRLREVGGRVVVEVGARRLRRAVEPSRMSRAESTLRWLAATCDAVLVAHESLVTDYLPYNPNVLVAPTRLDALCWGTAQPRRQAPEHGTALRMGLVAPLESDRHVQSLDAALRRLLAERRSELVVEVIDPGHGLAVGGLPLARRGGKRYPERAEHLRAHLDWDVAVVVPGRDAADDTVQQVLEYAALGIPVVAAELPELAGLVRDGETGLLCAADEHAWACALRRMLDDPRLRDALARRAHAALRERHTIEAQASFFRETLDRMTSLPLRGEQELALIPWAFQPAADGWWRWLRELKPGGRSQVSLWRRLRDAFGAPGRRPGAPPGSLRRKWLKFRRDPRAYLADSRYLVMRLLGAIAFPRPRLPEHWGESGAGEI